jgi:hypothetical protein
MSTSEEAILRMVAEGKISEAEARELIDALHEGPRSRFWINPFEHLVGPTGLVAAIALACAGMAFAPFGIRYSGPFDLHPHPGAIPWSTAVADWVTYFPLPAVVFWLAARLAGSQRVRLVDFVTLTGVLRFPYLVLGLLTLAVKFPKVGERPTALFYLYILAVLGGVVWYFLTLTTGYRTASGLRGKRLATSFVLAVVCCEIIGEIGLGALVGRR